MIHKNKNGFTEKAPNPVFRMEADAFSSDMELLITNVIGVSEFSEAKIVLMMKREKLEVLGSGMRISIYERNTVEISGGVSSFERFSRTHRVGGKDDKT